MAPAATEVVAEVAEAAVPTEATMVPITTAASRQAPEPMANPEVKATDTATDTDMALFWATSSVCQDRWPAESPTKLIATSEDSSEEVCLGEICTEAEEVVRTVAGTQILGARVAWEPPSMLVEVFEQSLTIN